MENPPKIKIKDNFQSVQEEVDKFTKHLLLNKGEDTSNKEIEKIKKEFKGFIEKIIKTKTDLEQHDIDEPNDSSQIAALVKDLDPVIAFEKKYTDTAIYKYFFSWTPNSETTIPTDLSLIHI